MELFGNGRNRVKTALLLAAGTGSRLQPLTDESPKCLTEINGTTILERLVRGLQLWEFERLVVVVGHLDGCLRDYLDNLVSGLDCLGSGLTIEYVSSAKYRTTNNIYSLWAARQVIQEPFLLLECDLIFDDALLGKMLVPDRIAVSHILPWMNGTTVSLDRFHQVIRFHMGKDQPPSRLTHKTVNMYSFSRTSWQRVTRRLEQYISAGRVNGYYEAVFAEMVAEGDLSFEAVFFDNECWYEIDTLDDLHEAERLFPGSNGQLTSGVV
ncbi:MAG: phosphocholine cytidylyltransferase family protein [Planctomycetes bacterium]|nr:phosphocholine cytidylyltransferase family protein [Planctomycetota bacterium]